MFWSRVCIAFSNLRFKLTNSFCKVSLVGIFARVWGEVLQALERRERSNSAQGWLERPVVPHPNLWPPNKICE